LADRACSDAHTLSKPRRCMSVACVSSSGASSAARSAASCRPAHAQRRRLFGRMTGAVLVCGQCGTGQPS
jgi:hypothetical protein